MPSTPDKRLRIMFMPGSSHSKSKSLAIVNMLTDSLTGCHCETPQIETLPFFSEDLNANKPQHVKAFLEHVLNCDGIVFVTPEYNHSIPAVLKNAIDWASRPAFASPLKGKPVTVITQSESSVGGARAQAHLKLVLDATLAAIHPFHEMLIAQADTLFDKDGQTIDPVVQRRLVRHMDDFLSFVKNSKAVHGA